MCGVWDPQKNLLDYKVSSESHCTKVIVMNKATFDREIAKYSITRGTDYIRERGVRVSYTSY